MVSSQLWGLQRAVRSLVASFCWHPPSALVSESSAALGRMVHTGLIPSKNVYLASTLCALGVAQRPMAAAAGRDQDAVGCRN